MKRLPKDIPLPPTNQPLFVKTKVLIEILKEKIDSIFNMKFKKRKNFLNTKDIFKIYFLSRKGDIFLVGDFKSPGNILVPGAFTHTALYLGKNRIIHSMVNLDNTKQGVRYSTLKDYVRTYDSFAILRLPQTIKHKHKIIKNVIKYAKLQLGKPYESYFKEDKKNFFCTELVNEAYRSAGYNTKLKSIKPFRTTIEKMQKNVFNVTHWLRPIEFMHSNFRIVFLSHNLAYNGKEILIRKDKLAENIK